MYMDGVLQLSREDAVLKILSGLLSEVWGRDVIIFYFGELKSRQSKFPMDIVFILWIKIYSTPKIVITITFCGKKSVEASY